MREFLINSQDDEIAKNTVYAGVGLAAPQINISKNDSCVFT